jgi:putrescine aminotransferase
VTVSPASTLEALVSRDTAHIVHPHCPPDARGRVVMARGEGSRVWDVRGREYLDMTGGGLWANLVGHGRAELAEAAESELRALGFFCTFWDFSNAPSIELAEQLAELAPERLDHVYFTCGGSEGIEVAIKMARLHHHVGGERGRDWVLGRRQAYHGIAPAGSAASDFAWLHEGFGPPLPHFAHLTPPWPYREELYGGQDPTDFLVAELEARIEEIGPERIAAFVGEPIMGVGGLLVPPDDYWPRVAEVLHGHGILLILDEVVTGYGRLGTWLAAERYGIDADLVVTAKGITSGYFPYGAVLIDREVAARVAGGDHGFPLGYTYTGHSAGAAVALANLELLRSEQLIARAPLAGERLRALLEPLAELPVVGEVRGAGLLAGIELVHDKETRRPMGAVDGVTDALREEHGVIVRAAMNSSLVLSPPLVVTDAELERCATAIAAVLRRTEPDGRVTREPR